MKPVWYVVHPESGARLCQDNCWRNFANLGTYPSCVKFYKRQGNAQRIADRFRVNGETLIKALYPNCTLDAIGNQEKIK